MTKEEYERLLQSDYWKGYSYSLIKERNFTCEDCGRRFENERNKLQVHHLVYRDVNPWSYKPEELIVLCEECHKKRHGIMTDSKPAYDSTDTEENWLQTYHSTRSGSSTYERDPYVYPMEKNNRFSNKRILFGILVLVALFFGISKIIDSSSTEKVYDAQQETVQQVDEDNWDIPELTTTKTTSRKTSGKKKDNYNNKEVTKKPGSLLTQEEEELNSPVESREVYGSQSKKSEATKPKKELSTLELLEKRQHEDVVRQAKRAGVSAEGSTIDILERIQHADVIKQAKRAGVSSEGSTIEILERIQHADVVKQAKRAGVSTEGSTIEILERIQRKELEKYNY